VNRALILLRDGTVPEQRLRGVAQLRMIAAQRRLRPAPEESPADRAYRAEAEAGTLVLAAHAATTKRKLWVRTAAVYAIGDWHPLCKRDHTVLLESGAKNEQLAPALRRAYERVVELDKSE
jgi:hypothetical protein